MAVLKAHPYRAVGTVLGVMAVLLVVSGLIGQHGDGPWGGLPEWLGAVCWFGFLLSALALLALTAYLLVANVHWRREHGTHHAHPV